LASSDVVRRTAAPTTTSDSPRGNRLKPGFSSKRVKLSRELKARYDVGSARNRRQMRREVLSYVSGYDLHEGVVEIAHSAA